MWCKHKWYQFTRFLLLVSFEWRHIIGSNRFEEVLHEHFALCSWLRGDWFVFIGTNQLRFKNYAYLSLIEMVSTNMRICQLYRTCHLVIIDRVIYCRWYRSIETFNELLTGSLMKMLLYERICWIRNQFSLMGLFARKQISFHLCPSLIDRRALPNWRKAKTLTSRRLNLKCL